MAALSRLLPSRLALLLVWGWLLATAAELRAQPAGAPAPVTAPAPAATRPSPPAPALPASSLPPPTPAQVQVLVEHLDRLYLGEAVTAELQLTIETGRRTSEVRLRSWSRDLERTLLRVQSPPRVAGMATLRRGDELWNWLPGTGRLLKVPSSMLATPWLGSHVTYDDLVKVTRLAVDYQCRAAGGPLPLPVSPPATTPDPGPPPSPAPRLAPTPVPTGAATLRLVCPARPDRPVEWSRIELTLRLPERLPLSLRYLDARGRVARTVDYDDVGPLGGRLLPRRITVRPADQPGERTVLTYRALDFAADVPERTFSVQHLGTR